MKNLVNIREQLINLIGEAEADNYFEHYMDCICIKQRNLKKTRSFYQNNINRNNMLLIFRGLSSAANKDELILTEMLIDKMTRYINYLEETAESTEETAESTEETAESTEETAESTEETEYYIAGVKIDKYTADDLYWEEIAYCCGYDPALADVVDKNTSEDLWWEEVAYICGYDPSLANDNEEVIEEDIKMDNNINDVSSNVFFFTERGQMELNRIRVKGVHANDFLVGSITDDAKNLMLEMKPMNHEFNKSDFITMGYLIEEALKSYSRFYEYCQYIYGLGAVEGDFDDFIYQMRLSIELGEITVDELVA